MQYVCTAVQELDWLPARDLIHQMLKLVAGLDAASKKQLRGKKVISTNAMQTVISYVKTSESVQQLKTHHPTGEELYPDPEVQEVASEFPSHIVRGVIVHASSDANPGKTPLPQIKFGDLTDQVQQRIRSARGKPIEDLVSHSIALRAAFRLFVLFCSI